MTIYRLTSHTFGDHPKFDLTREEYDAIRAAQRHAAQGAAFEARFDRMLGNYEEFERELLVIALREATYWDADDEGNVSLETIQLIARRLDNLLTTMYAYYDQTLHAISGLYGGTKTPHYVAVDWFFSEEYEATLGYRVCFAIRNHVQHGDSIDHGYTAQDRWVDRPGGHRVRIAYIAPEVSVERLRENERFNKRVLRDLEHGGRQAYGERRYDLRPFVRECVSGLGRVHLKVREIIETDLRASEKVIADAVARFLAAPGSEGSAIGLSLMELNDKGLLEGRTPTYVGTRPSNRRQLLQRRNHLPTHFETQVVTNEVEMR